MNVCLSRRILDSRCLSGLSQFAHRSNLDLPDPLFGYAHRGSDLRQRQGLMAADQAKTRRDNLPLPFVESVEDPLYLRLPPDLADSCS